MLAVVVRCLSPLLDVNLIADELIISDLWSILIRFAFSVQVFHWLSSSVLTFLSFTSSACSIFPLLPLSLSVFLIECELTLAVVHYFVYPVWFHRNKKHDEWRWLSHTHTHTQTSHKCEKPLSLQMLEVIVMMSSCVVVVTSPSHCPHSPI